MHLFFTPVQNVGVEWALVLPASAPCNTPTDHSKLHHWPDTKVVHFFPGYIRKSFVGFMGGTIPIMRYGVVF